MSVNFNVDVINAFLKIFGGDAGRNDLMFVVENGTKSHLNLFYYVEHGDLQNAESLSVGPRKEPEKPGEDATATNAELGFKAAGNGVYATIVIESDKWQLGVLARTPPNDYNYFICHPIGQAHKDDARARFAHEWLEKHNNWTATLDGWHFSQNGAFSFLLQDETKNSGQTVTGVKIWITGTGAAACRIEVVDLDPWPVDWGPGPVLTK